MSYTQRINRIEFNMINNKDLFSPPPQFANYSNEDLEKYIEVETKKHHKEFAITNYESAVKRLNFEFVQGFISEDELKLFLEYEKEFWDINK